MSEDFHSYFDDALRIHAICVDNGLSENEARLLTYMHTKGCESGKGIDYFFDPSMDEAEALEIMLGERKKPLPLPAVASLDEEGHEAIHTILTIADRISNLDRYLAEECGLENRLSGELRHRLRLYRDRTFRARMIDLYKSNVVPKMDDYTRERVHQAFRKYRIEKQRREKEIMRSAGLSE